jgi:hypothetical protein
VVSYGPDSGAKYITTYFRRSFAVSDPASFTALSLRVMRDDGVIVYLNGSEIFRNNMPAGAAGYLTPASAALGGVDEYTFVPATLDPGYLVFGNNVVAVEIHQNSGASSDISFDLELTGVQSHLAPHIVAQPTNQTAATGSDVSFVVAADGSAPLAYQWKFNSNNIAGATNATLVRSNVQAGFAGSYFVVVTNIAGSATSQVALLTVTNPDTDGDGLPDAWENAYGLNPSNPNDAALDSDGDGMTNLQEFRAGTNPKDPLSVLKLSVTSLIPVRLQFVAQSNLSYSVQFNTNIAVNSWIGLSNISAQSLMRTVIVNDLNPATNRVRFYRAVTP